MPLIKSDGGSGDCSMRGGDVAALVTALADPDPEVRWQAARSAGASADAVPALADALARESVARVRETIMTALMRIGDAASVEALLPALRAQDASLRAAAIETLQAMPQATRPFMAALLADDDIDVRILATELARNMMAEEATALLSDALRRESHANVCGAVVDVLAEIGTKAAIPALRDCAARFAGTPFLPFAIGVAIAQISGDEA